MSSERRANRNLILLFVVLALVFFIFAGQLLAPRFILGRVNQYLEERKSPYILQVADTGVNFFTLSLALEGITGRLRTETGNFLVVKRLRVRVIPWELLRLRIALDIDITDPRGNLSEAVLDAFLKKDNAPPTTDEPARGESDAKVSFPLEIKSLKLHGGAMKIAGMPRFKLNEAVELSELDISVKNLLPADADGATEIAGEGKFSETARLKAKAAIRWKREPADWDLDLEVRDFKLTRTNPLLMQLFPLSFNGGNMSLFLEFQNVSGVMRGYVKPFFDDIDVVGNRSDFQGAKHLVFDVAAGLAHLILENPATKTLSTKIDFKEVDGKLQMDTGKALKLVLANNDQELKPAVEESLSLPPPRPARERSKN